MTSSKDDTSNMDYDNIGQSNFKYSGTRTEDLGASEYTLVTMAIDTTTSVGGYEKLIRDCLIIAVKSCQKSPRADNLLLRVILFNTYISGGIKEIHGFKPLAEINPDDYPNLKTDGSTNLFDAAYSAVAATNDYAKKLHDNHFACNAINFIITDGDNNRSTMTAQAVAREVKKALQAEYIESVISVLIGINAAMYKQELQAFQKDAKLDKYIDAGDATEDTLAKLAEFVASSVGSQSKAMGSGAPAPDISASI